MDENSLYFFKFYQKISMKMHDKSALELLVRGDFEKDALHSALLFKGREREQLFELARNKRDEYFPSRQVEVRSVIEISNICRSKCNFCNINFYARNRKGYCLTYEEIMGIAKRLYYKNRKVILLQSGENKSQKYIDFVCKCISGIKKKFKDLVIILCLGSLSRLQFRQLRQAGAERYILKFETSNPVLYKNIKPDDSLEERVNGLVALSESGFEVGTGNIIGLPGQTIEDIVNDLFFIRNFKLTMVSSSVFIPGEDSNYRNEPKGGINIILNYIALIRILYPQMLIPSTSSLEKAKKGGQHLGLLAGANTVTIHDGTPAGIKKYFPIYSVKRFTPDEKRIKKVVEKAHLIANVTMPVKNS